MDGFLSAHMLALVWVVAYVTATRILNDTGWFGLAPFVGAGALHYHLWTTKSRDAAARAEERASLPLRLGIFVGLSLLGVLVFLLMDYFFG